ncbi:hypothetical protein D3C87_1568410 [compost metagenome]
MAYSVKKFIRSAMAGSIEVILAGILFTISIVLREKKRRAKKGLKFSMNYYYKDTISFFRLSCRLACCHRRAAWI